LAAVYVRTNAPPGPSPFRSEPVRRGKVRDDWHRFRIRGTAVAVRLAGEASSGSGRMAAEVGWPGKVIRDAERQLWTRAT
jgi:hypothetical protein